MNLNQMVEALTSPPLKPRSAIDDCLRHPAVTAVPDGWVMVPIDCTDDIAEVIAAEAGCCGGIAEQIWRHAIAAAPAVQPLTPEKIDYLFHDCVRLHDSNPLWFARAIEQAHGITGGTRNG